GTTPLTNFTLQFQLKHLQPDGHYTSVDLDSITNAPRRALVTPSQVKAHIFDPTPLPLDVLTSTWGAPSLSYFPANRQAEFWFDVQGTVGPNGLISDAKLELQTVMSPEPSSALLMLPAVGVCLWLRRRQARRRLVPATVQST
ncbi:MAG: PEP-CTERM sorting domain-containing protein, partial [Planctomycetaceae bacterium]